MSIPQFDNHTMNKLFQKFKADDLSESNILGFMEHSDTNDFARTIERIAALKKSKTYRLIKAYVEEVCHHNSFATHLTLRSSLDALAFSTSIPMRSCLRKIQSSWFLTL
jgi:hypothetical protein